MEGGLRPGLRPGLTACTAKHPGDFTLGDPSQPEGPLRPSSRQQGVRCRSVCLRDSTPRPDCSSDSRGLCARLPSAPLTGGPLLSAVVVRWQSLGTPDQDRGSGRPQQGSWAGVIAVDLPAWPALCSSVSVPVPRLCRGRCNSHPAQFRGFESKLHNRRLSGLFTHSQCYGMSVSGTPAPGTLSSALS